MLPLLMALAALATPTALYAQTPRFSTSQSHHCVAAQPHATRHALGTPA
jgi:hypothetical protein